MTIRPNYELVRYTGNKLLGHAKEQIFSAVEKKGPKSSIIGPSHQNNLV